MWNPNQPAVENSHEEDDSWEVRAFAEDTGNVMGTTWPPRSYTCTFCRREFRSAQALGGHMNVHRRDRARLHQSLPNSKNPNYISSTSSSNLLIPTQDLVGNNGGLCLLYSLPSPNNNHNNSLFTPLKTFSDNPSSTLLSITPHHTSNANFMNFNQLALPPPPHHHHNIQSSPSNSSNTETSMSTNNRNNRVTFTNSAVEEIGANISSPLNQLSYTPLAAVEEIDLELRLGRSSSSTPS